MSGLYDVMIVGGGPAGLAAAIYTSRAKLKTVILEKETLGGQPMNTELIENYPGFEEGISGRNWVRGCSAGDEVRSRTGMCGCRRDQGQSGPDPDGPCLHRRIYRPDAAECRRSEAQETRGSRGGGFFPEGGHLLRFLRRKPACRPGSGGCGWRRFGNYGSNASFPSREEGYSARTVA